MDNLNQWIDDRQSFERARHPQKKMRMQFKVGDHKDSNIRMLTGTIKADWIQLPKGI